MEQNRALRNLMIFLLINGYAFVMPFVVAMFINCVFPSYEITVGGILFASFVACTFSSGGVLSCLDLLP